MRPLLAGSIALLAAAGAVSAAPAAQAANPVCPPSAAALSFSDSLDKLDVGGATVGGLSDLAYDRRAGAWASTVDNHASDPARIWFFRDLTHPTVVGPPLVLKKPDGSPYDGTTADDEGLAVLPDGDYLVSSETEPSIRIFGRDGVQKSELPVPARFAVTGTTPAGEATANATLEGLTITPNGKRVVAAMEGALSGDVTADGDATLHRFLVYDVTRAGHWKLTRQIKYRTETGQRVPEVVAYRNDSLVVEEASFDPATGNQVKLYAVPDFDRGPGVVRKQLVADVVKCPSLGATAKQPQANPLLDNYEGMALTGITPGRHPFAGLTLISDDNFGATQVTRVLNLAARLP